MSSRIEPVSSAATKPQLATASEAKRILLERYLRGDAVQTLNTVREIPHRDPGGPQQLAFAQERLWFLDQLTPGSPVFNVPMAVRLSRPIDLDALQLSVNEIVRRHEILRTNFVTINGEPRALISAQAEIDIQVIELGARQRETAETESRILIEKEVLRPFDLSQGQLIRTTLIRLNEKDSILVVVMHHIVSDGWSLLLFFKELAALYDRCANQARPALPDLRIQYGDYAAWHRDWLRDEVLEQQLAYWKD